MNSFSISDSILDSVKKFLGLNKENKEFDTDILICINSSIVTLWQIGIGVEGFTVTDDEVTYEDYLGADCPYYAMVNLYLCYETRLGFDPPSNSSLLQNMEEKSKELEWRLNAYVDPVDTFDEKN